MSGTNDARPGCPDVVGSTYRFGVAARSYRLHSAPSPRDLFRRNEVVFRNEIRVGLELLSFPSLRVADLTE